MGISKSAALGVAALVSAQLLFFAPRTAALNVNVAFPNRVAVVCGGRTINGRPILGRQNTVSIAYVEPARRRGCLIQLTFGFQRNHRDPHRRAAVVLQRLFMGAGQYNLRSLPGPVLRMSMIRPR